MIEPPVGRKDAPALPPSPEDALGWKDVATPLRTTAVGANVVLGGLSTALAVWADGLGRWLLIALVAVSLLVLLAQLAVAGLRGRHRAELARAEERHRLELAAAREEVVRATERATEVATELIGLQAAAGRQAAAVTALRDMWLGYPAPYTDEVELTYLIGPTADGDRVVEHRRTRAGRGAALPFLQARLTTPTQLGAEVVRLPDTEMVARSEDDRTAVRTIALAEAPGLLRCMFVFVPSISGAPVDWFARYRMRGLWDTLRGTGHDRLTWTPTARVADPTESTIARLTVNFDFPPEVGDDVFVRDQNNNELKRLSGPDGSLRYQWTCEDPPPELHTWELWWARARS